jgi:hypothetical protein
MAADPECPAPPVRQAPAVAAASDVPVEAAPPRVPRATGETKVPTAPDGL